MAVRRALALLLLVLLFAAAWLGRQLSVENPAPALPLNQALGDGEQGFARAEHPRPFHFPADHGPHPDYKTEWWYITGNLQSETGQRYGYQLTFFRIGLRPAAHDRPSAWAASQFYMAHAALSDLDTQRFYSRERFARSALDLAGAQASPQITVWLEDWQLQSAGAALFPLTVTIDADDFRYALTLETAKPVVLHGEDGLSRKGATSGNASYYYSYTRLPTRGTLTLDGHSYQVSGDSWLDREWSTSVLPPGVVGWDWFAIQLDNHSELMFYRLRTREGAATPFSRGSLVRADGTTIDLPATEVHATPTQWWTSPLSAVRYPIAWTITVPAHALQLEVQATLPQQELNHSVRYWEGSVVAQGHYQQQAVSGRGYLELAGYE